MFKVISCDVRFFITLLKILPYFRELFPDFLLGKGNKKKCEFIFGICFKSEASYKTQ